MKKALKKKLTLSRETIVSLEAETLLEVIGGNLQGPAFSDEILSRVVDDGLIRRPSSAT